MLGYIFMGAVLVGALGMLWAGRSYRSRPADPRTNGRRSDAGA